MKAIIVRYHEIALKKGNRSRFEGQLISNLKSLMWREHQRDHAVRRLYGRILLTAEAFDARFLRLLSLTPGVKSFSPAERIDARDPAGIAAAAQEYFERTRPRDRRIRFRVRVNRGDKTLPFRSDAFERELAERLLTPLAPDAFTVDLETPDYALEVDARPEGVFLLHERTQGAGGLPVGVSGRALCLLSGGIDSPVAAYLMMTRGAAVDFLSFVSPPYTDEAVETKLTDLAAKLAEVAGPCRLHLVPFTRVQEAVRDGCPETHRTILYRRFMLRIGDHLADAAGHDAFITGESLGQVSSQTVENMSAIGAATRRLVFRPLIGADKEAAVAVARRLGTFDISIRPAADTCTLFAPASPVTKARMRDVEAIEAKLPCAELAREAFENLRVVDVGR